MCLTQGLLHGPCPLPALPGTGGLWQGGLDKPAAGESSYFGPPQPATPCLQRSCVWLPQGHPGKGRESSLFHCCSCCLVAKSCLTLLPPQAPLSMEFSSQEYWSGLPFPFPGHLPNPGIEPTSPAMAGGFFTTEPPRTKCPLSQVQTDPKMQVLLCPQDLQLE